MRERLSKKDTANMLMERSPRIYIGDKYKEFIQREAEAKAIGQKLRYDRFAVMLCRLAWQKGLDISKFI